MTNRKDGGAAFPQLFVEACERDGHGDLIDPFTSSQGGMSLRDWFAGMALQSLNNQTFYYDENNTNTYPIRTCSDKAIYSYKIADAMLAEREKAGGDE